jgi:hypothetical protein
MGKVKEWLIKQQEEQMEQDEIDAMWHQKQLEEEQLIEIAKQKNMFEWQAIQDAIYYSKRLRAVEDK